MMLALCILAIQNPINSFDQLVATRELITTSETQRMDSYVHNLRDPSLRYYIYIDAYALEDSEHFERSVRLYESLMAAKREGRPYLDIISPITKLPIGDRNLITVGGGAFVFKLTGKNVLVSYNVSSSYERMGTSPKPKTENLEWLPEFAEAAARWALAEAEAKTFTEQNLSLSGKTYAAYRDRDGREYLPLRKVLDDDNIVYKWNGGDGRLSFVKNGVEYLYVLGADKYKIGDSWFEMDGIVSARDQNIYVPVDG